MRVILGTIPIAMLFLAVPVMAQESEDAGGIVIPTAQSLEAVAAQIPQHEWYPQGYRDLRIAALDSFLATEEAQNAEPYDYSTYNQVNIGDCGADDLGFDDDSDDLQVSLSYLATDMAKFRFRFQKAGYPDALLDPAMLAYERHRIAEILVYASGRYPSEVDMAAEFGIEAPEGSYPLGTLLDTLNAARTGENADLPEAIMADGCGGEYFPVVIRTAPGGGQVWVMSAFAFRVCTRRNPDPWDKFACRWNEIETGAATTDLGGRYVYEVVWPDGTSRRGTREIRGEYREKGATTVTFRRTGS